MSAREEAAPSDPELRAGLESALGELGLASPRRVERHPSAYRTSFPIENLEVELTDGEELRMVFKQLGRDNLDDAARLAKPDFLHDSLREPAVYASVLAPAGLTTPRYFGSVTDPRSGRYWLFVERIDGVELYQVGDLALWQKTARWLARMHVQLAGDLQRLREPGRLLDYDAAYYRRWIERARELAGAYDDSTARMQALDWLGARYDVVIEELLAMPRTVIHGELYASNVLVDAGGGDASRICPVDWELAAAGPGPVDLAALVSGDWAEGDRAAIVSAYAEEAGRDPAAAWRELDICRLHLAVQWLGWAPADWQPPEGHRHDWLREAMALAEGLDL